jgi:hypothetical protein
MVYRGRFQGLPERGSRGPHGRPREPLKPLSKTPFISDIGGRIWYIRGSRARLWRSPRTSRLRGRGQRASFGQARNAFKTELASGGGVRAAPKPDSRADGFRRAWKYFLAPPCILHGTPLAPNASNSQAKCVPNGGFGTVTSHSADLVNWKLTKSAVRHSAPRALLCACLIGGSGSARTMCGSAVRCVPHRSRCVPHRLARVPRMGAQGGGSSRMLPRTLLPHVAAPIWAHLGPRWAHVGPHVWAHVWAHFACTLGPI